MSTTSPSPARRPTIRRARRDDARGARPGRDRAARRDHRLGARRRAAGRHDRRALFQDPPLCRIEGPPRGPRARLPRDPPGGERPAIGPRRDARPGRRRCRAAAAVRRLAARPGADRGRRGRRRSRRRAGLAAAELRSAGRRRTNGRPCSSARRSTCASTSRGPTREAWPRRFPAPSRRRIADGPAPAPTAEVDDIRPSATGLVEVQDEGSQLICLGLRGRSRACSIVDLCAGAGGKTLALAAEMAPEAEIIACDTDRAPALAAAAARSSAPARRSSRRGCSIRGREAGRAGRPCRPGRSRAGRRALLGHRHLAAQSRRRAGG